MRNYISPTHFSDESASSSSSATQSRCKSNSIWLCTQSVRRYRLLVAACEHAWVMCPAPLTTKEEIIDIVHSSENISPNWSGLVSRALNHLWRSIKNWMCLSSILIAVWTLSQFSITLVIKKACTHKGSPLQPFRRVPIIPGSLPLSQDPYYSLLPELMVAIFLLLQDTSRKSHTARIGRNAFCSLLLRRGDAVRGFVE